MEEKKRARETHNDQLATSPGNSLALSLVGYFFSLLLAFLLITNISIPLEPVSIPLQHRCVSAGARAEDGLTIENRAVSLSLLVRRRRCLKGTHANERTRSIPRRRSLC